MKRIKTTKEAFNKDLAALLDKFDVFAPSTKQGKLDYLNITDPEDITWTDDLPYKSPKETVFPRVEEIMRFTKDDVVPTANVKPVLLLGAKPCDIESFDVFDGVFTSEKGLYIDPFYKERRDKMLIIGSGCAAKKPGCFCDERGYDMTFSDKCDAFVALDGDDMYIDLITDRAEGLFSGSDCPPREVNKAPETTLKIDAHENDIFTTMPWEDWAMSCIGCGTCTYVCPTCHCFDIRDADDKGEVTRCRLWDSCMYSNFTLHAGGTNPRTTQAARYRQRVMHKYVYLRDNIGITACTGCGRCIRLCPGGINIHDTVKDIMGRTEKK